MPQIETQEESAAVEHAYLAWVAKARERGQNRERDIWRAAWVAGRDWSEVETTRRLMNRSGLRLMGCTHTPSCASVGECASK